MKAFKERNEKKDKHSVYPCIFWHILPHSDCPVFQHPEGQNPPLTDSKVQIIYDKKATVSTDYLAKESVRRLNLLSAMG